ncbi:MAG: lysylphosphatidylglycerol synthase transmembrane domain-containing protein [Roseiflexaceae bacterium]
MTAIIIGAALNHRSWLLAALSLVVQVEWHWLLGGLLIIQLSFLISSRVFAVALHALGHRAGAGWLWLTTVGAILISQLIPAGGVGSYAFLIGRLRQRGASFAEAALIALLESLSYSIAMLILTMFGVLYLADMLSDQVGGVLLVAAGVGVFALSGVLLLAYDPSWLRRVYLWAMWLVRRPADAERIRGVIAELQHLRGVMMAQSRVLLVLVLLQLGALSGHSLGLGLILRSLGVELPWLSTLATFAMVLLTSSLNVLPGGGGTVEAALVVLLSQQGAGSAAVPAAMLFRLSNFWLMIPVLLLSGRWRRSIWR